MELEIASDNCSCHTFPYNDIFGFWPKLRTVTIREPVKYEIPNCDADFCGLYEEEVELLWNKGEEYVPLNNERYVLTVSGRGYLNGWNGHKSVPFLADLQRLILIGFSGDRNPDDDSRDDRSLFFSSVTEFLVLKRMLWLRVTQF